MTAERAKQILLKEPLYTLGFFWLVTRLVCVLLYQHVTMFPDSEGYVELAKILSAFNIAGYTGERSPGYPLLLLLTGNSLPLTIGLQLLLGLCTTIVLYKTLLRLQFGTWPALATTMALTGLLHFIFYETAILTESFTLLVVTVIFYLLFSGFFVRANFRQTLLLGFLLGYLVFIKPFYIFMPFVIYGLYVLQRFHLRAFINQRLLVFVFPLVAFLGWSYVNKVNTGYFVSSTFFGINIAQNCVYFAEKAPEEYRLISNIYVKHREEAIRNDRDVAMSIWYGYDELTQETGLPFVDLSNELGEFAKETIKNNRVDYLKQVGLSWKEFWTTSIYLNYNDFKVPYVNKLLYGLWLLQSFVLLCLKVAFVLLAPFHLYQYIKKRVVTPQFIITAIVLCASLLQAMTVFGTNSRFSYPFEFYMVIVVLLTFRTGVRPTLKPGQ